MTPERRGISTSDDASASSTPEAAATFQAVAEVDIDTVTKSHGATVQWRGKKSTIISQ